MFRSYFACCVFFSDQLLICIAGGVKVRCLAGLMASESDVKCWDKLLSYCLSISTDSLTVASLKSIGKILLDQHIYNVARDHVLGFKSVETSGFASFM